MNQDHLPDRILTQAAISTEPPSLTDLEENCVAPSSEQPRETRDLIHLVGKQKKLIMFSCQTTFQYFLLHKRIIEHTAC